MKHFSLARRLNNKKFKLPTCLFLLALIFSSVTLAYDTGGYKNLPTKIDNSVQPVAKPSIGEHADESCSCECINEKWVCTPAGGGCDLTGACGDGVDWSGPNLNSRTIPAVTQPALTNPARQIDPKVVPGDQFETKTVPGDQFNR